MEQQRMPWRHVWDYNRQVLHRTGKAWWRIRGWQLATDLVAGLFTGGAAYLLGGVPVWAAVGVGVVTIFGAGFLSLVLISLKESAERDWQQIRRLNSAAGVLTEEEVQQANRDREHVQTLARELVEWWGYFEASHGTGENQVKECEKRLREVVEQLLSVLRTTRHERRGAYLGIVDNFQKDLLRIHPDESGRRRRMSRAVMIIGKLEREDRRWAEKERLFRPPIDPPQSKNDS